VQHFHTRVLVNCVKDGDLHIAEGDEVSEELRQVAEAGSFETGGALCECQRLLSRSDSTVPGAEEDIWGLLSRQARILLANACNHPKISAAS
jgi:hypothetical protein